MRNGKNYIPGMYTRDDEKVRGMCLNCAEPNCPGDCEARRIAAGIRFDRANQKSRRGAINEQELSTREKEFLALYDLGMIDRECDSAMGICESSVHSIRAKLGLPALGTPGRRKEAAKS